MPVTNINQNNFPDWSELDYFDVIRLDFLQEYSHKKKSNKESIFIGEGNCELVWNKRKSILHYGDHFHNSAAAIDIISNTKQCTLIIIGGNWDDQTGNSGVFKMRWSPNPRNIGDPTDYDRNTDFDNHYHDCDEYWIIFNGNADVVSEGNHYHISDGDCLITKMGDHHDIVHIEDYLEGIYFETTLRGEKRLGHLWKYKEN